MGRATRSRSSSYERTSSRRRLRSRSPRCFDGRDAPAPCECLGVFGMSLYTREHHLREAFERFAEVTKVTIVYSRYAPYESRGFGFVYFGNKADASRALEQMQGQTIDGVQVRIDYSVTRCGGPDRHNRSHRSDARRDSRSPLRQGQRPISTSPSRYRPRSRSRSSSPRDRRSPRRSSRSSRR